MKRAFRERYLDIRRRVQDKSAKDSAILGCILSAPLYINTDSIMTYVSTQEEIDTRRLIDAALADGKRVFVPKIIGRGELAVCEINDKTELFPGKYGIEEPKTTHAVREDEIGLIIAPAIAISADGYRMGYGGGYYDRLLTRTHCPAIGLCYHDCLVDSMPSEEHDVPVGYIITEKGLQKNV